jgi:cell division protein FtsA
MVIDLNATATAMLEAVAAAERMSRRTAEGALVVLSVSGPHVLSVMGRAEVAVADPDGGVTEADVESALNEASLVELPPGRKVIHVVPRAYRLDGAGGVMDPTGLAGRVLAAEAHLVTVEALPVQNYLRAAVKADVQVSDFQLGLYAAAEAVLTPAERADGALVLDFGAGMTGIAIYEHGRLWHAGIVPVGGEHVTRDLATLLQVPMAVAERLKTERGWAAVDLCPDTSLELVASTGQKAREMQDKRLAQIIEPRVQEILQLVSEQVKASGYGGVFAGGLILTGGGARLKGLLESAANWFGIPARIGVPKGSLVGGPEFATAVGLCRWGAGLVMAQPEMALEHAKAADNEQDKRGGAKNWLGSLFG